MKDNGVTIDKMLDYQVTTSFVLLLIKYMKEANDTHNPPAPEYEYIIFISYYPMHDNNIIHNNLMDG